MNALTQSWVTVVDLLLTQNRHMLMTQDVRRPESYGVWNRTECGGMVTTHAYGRAVIPHVLPFLWDYWKD